MSIKLQFVLGSSLSSRLIAWWGSGYNGWSHVDAVLNDGSLLGARSDSVGGQPPGVRIRPPNYERWKKRAVLTLPSTPEQVAAWEYWLRTQVGLGYDKGDILGLILGRPMAQPGHWICSALQANALEVCGRIPKLCVTPQQIPPNMLAVTLSALGAT